MCDFIDFVLKIFMLLADPPPQITIHQFNFLKFIFLGLCHALKRAVTSEAHMPHTPALATLARNEWPALNLLLLLFLLVLLLVLSLLRHLLPSSIKSN